MKHAVRIAVATAVIVTTAYLAAPGSAQANPYLQLAADTAGSLNAQELGRIQAGQPPMPPPPTAAPMEAAQGCPAGSRWVPAGYGKHGKWRPAGCYRR